MPARDPQGKLLRELHAPRRNRYFAGRLLDAADFSREQEYWLARERQLNRHVLGHGVVSGLRVTAVQNRNGRGIRVEPGLAIDPLGRVIVVPEAHELVPIALTDECGNPADSRTHQLPRTLVVSLCYREYPADFRPTIVPEPPGEGAEHTEAGTWIETYAIRIREGTGETVSVPCLDEVLEAVRAGDLHRAVCALTDAADAPLPECPCVVLANLSTCTEGTLEVDECTARRILPTNQLLLALIACLAEQGLRD